jgi:hypothetical protein
MTARKLGDPQEQRVRRLASRRQGVTVPEVAEFFGVQWACASRFVLRLVKLRTLMNTDETRRRTEVFGAKPSRPCRVYRARKPVPTGPRQYSQAI